jgi:methyl-accepting chemotaxis protein
VEAAAEKYGGVAVAADIAAGTFGTPASSLPSSSSSESAAAAARLDYGGGPGVTSWTYTVEIGGYGTVDRHVDVNAGTITMTDHDTGDLLASFSAGVWDTYIHPYAEKPVTPASGVLSTVVGMVLGQIQPVIDAALSPILSQIRALSRLMTTAVDAVYDFISRQVTAVTIATVTAYKELQKYFDDAVGKVSGALQVVYKTVQGWISAAVNAASSLLQQAINTVQSVLQAADQAIRDTVNQLWTWVLQQVNNLVNEVHNLWVKLQEIVQAAREEAEKTAKAIADLNDSLQLWVQDNILWLFLESLDRWVTS